jgi:predicted MFS family arabinose efflux permease
VGSFLAYADRFAIPPVLVAISRDLNEPLAAVTAVATLYFFFYAAMQPVYGLLSDRLGRVRVMRGALVGMAVANAAAAAAPGLGALVAAKAIAAGFAASLLPTSLVYVGDRVAFAARQHVIANLLAAGALGTALATVASGVLASLVGWRAAFALLALIALLLAIVMGGVPESLSPERRAGPMTQIRRVLSRRWARFLVVLALAEGATMVGFITFLAPALQAHGESAALAGLVVAAYGVAVFAGMQLLKRVIRATGAPAPALIASGGTLLFVAYLIAAADQGPLSILIASLVIGLGYCFLHSTLQTWATELAPEARGTATSLFVTAVFIGAAIGTAAVSGLADEQRYGLVFLIAAAITVPVAVIGALARARYGRSV